MISKKMEKALNKQINEELYSAYLYLAISAYCDRQGLRGFAHWFDLQNQEETTHARKFYDYLQEQGARVHLQAIAEPEREFGSPLEVFQAAHKHEKHITGCINKLADLAQIEKDHATGILLQWFVSEQVEEEANVSAIVDELKLIGNDKRALLMIDRELKARVLGGGASEEA